MGLDGVEAETQSPPANMLGGDKALGLRGIRPSLPAQPPLATPPGSSGTQQGRDSWSTGAKKPKGWPAKGLETGGGAP